MYWSVMNRSVMNVVWSVMNVVCCECGLLWRGLLWMGLLWSRSVMSGSVMIMVCYERGCCEHGLLWTWSVFKCGPLWTWSVMNMVCYECGLLWTGLLWTWSVFKCGPLWTWCVMNMVCYEGGLLWTGLLWTWSVMNAVCYERVCFEREPWKPQEAGVGAGAMWNESSRAGATLKIKSSGAGTMFMKRSPKPELCHFYDDSAARK